jgi:hypothetical protein
MKKRSLLLAATCLLLPIQSVVLADDFEAENSDYRFEFKVAKKRANSDEKQKKKPRDRQQQPGPEMEDTEMWLYKVQVENKSLSDVDSLEARYTIYLSPSKSRRGGGPGGGGPGGAQGGGGGDNAEEPSVRTVTGETTLDPIKRGNREVFETISSAIAKGGKQRGGPPGGGGQGDPGAGGPPGGGGRNGGQGGGPDQPRGPETLDGIKIELFLGEEKVGEYIYGNAAKQATAAEKKSEEKADRED